MKSEKEIRETLIKIGQISGFINDYSDRPKEYNHEQVAYANSVSDVVYWILDDRISNEDFLSEDYVDIPFLEKMAKNIEDRTGKKLKEYSSQMTPQMEKEELELIKELEDYK